MKTKEEIMELLKTKKMPKVVGNTLKWVLGEDALNEEFKKIVTQKQKSAKGKSKGSAFELAIANKLSLWWTNGEDDKYLRRVPLSGGYDKTAISGDIACLHNPLDWPLSIECKNQEGWDIFQIFEGVGPVLGWWKQCTEDEKQGRYIRQPILIMTKNRCPVLVMCNYGFYRKIIQLPGKLVDYVIINNSNSKEVFVLFKLDDFLKWVSKFDIIKAFQVEKRSKA